MEPRELEETVFEDHLSIDPAVHQVGAGQVNYGNPGQLRPHFHWVSVKNEYQSTIQGHPVFEKREYVRIPFPGTRDFFDGPVTDHFRRVFPQQYRAFKLAAQEVERGMPIKECPLFDVTEVDQLAYYQIFSVEQLAETPDANVATRPGGVRLREKARKYLANAQGMAPIGALEAENKQLVETVKAQAEMLKQVQGQMQQLLSAQTEKAPTAPAEPEEQKLVVPEIPKQEKRHEKR